MEKEITESILNGLENNEFKMYLQFVVDNKTQKIVSVDFIPFNLKSETS